MRATPSARGSTVSTEADELSLDMIEVNSLVRDIVELPDRIRRNSFRA
jgi:hypothetical protein